MPRGDGRGPAGFGYNRPGSFHPARRVNGYGRGRGLRRRMRLHHPGFYPPRMARGDEKRYLEDERDFLSNQLDYLKDEIEAIDKRLDELKKEDDN